VGAAAQQVAGHIKRAIDGPMWHGPALAELLAGVSAEEAAAHPVPGAHSIWELVLHLTAWAEIVRSRLAGTAAARVTTEEDWPPVADATAAGWKAAVTRLGDAYRAVAADAGLLDDESLARIVTGRDHSISAMLHGVIEHGAYHGGQIAVLKRAGLTPARG
jgi:uncharacterized damage-inducible protein DinB